MYLVLGLALKFNFSHTMIQERDFELEDGCNSSQSRSRTQHQTSATTVI